MDHQQLCEFLGNVSLFFFVGCCLIGFVQFIECVCDNDDERWDDDE
jgi:hypothetical protein